MMGVSISRTTWPVIWMPLSAIDMSSDVILALVDRRAPFLGFGATFEDQVQELPVVGDGEPGPRSDEALGDGEPGQGAGRAGRDRECVHGVGRGRVSVS
jgi:hypothetical protein